MIDLSNVDVEDLLDKLDVANARLTASGSEVNFSCFGGEHSHGDESPSAYINVETTAWFCHGCKRKGNAVSLVMEVQQVPKAAAEHALRDWYGIEFDEPNGGSMAAETSARFREPEPEPEPLRPTSTWLISTKIRWRDVVEKAERMACDISPEEAYLLDRGLSPEVLEEWDIGYDFLSNRVTIPVFNVDGELVGVKGRDWTGQRKPKYLVLGDRPDWTGYGFSAYEPSQVVFGLHRNRGCKTVVICEGELNALALSQMGIPRPVAIGMSYFSQRHADLVIREANEAIIYVDHGDAGTICATGRRDPNGRVLKPGILQMLEPYMSVKLVTPDLEDPLDHLKDGDSQRSLDLILSAKSSLALEPILG